MVWIVYEWIHLIRKRVDRIVKIHRFETEQEALDYVATHQPARTGAYFGYPVEAK